MIAFYLLPYQDNWPSNWRLIVNQLDAITFTNNHIETIIRNFGIAAKKNIHGPTYIYFVVALF